jgi:hypothetical protein
MKAIWLTPLVVIIGLGSLSPVAAQPTAFTYQGFVTDQGAPANGAYDLIVTDYSAPVGGSSTAFNLLTNVGITNGLFTVTVDLGEITFSGADRWLEIGVRPNGGGSFSTLTPRHRVTSTPYAIRALNFSGIIASAQLTGTYTNPVTFTDPGSTFAGAFAGNGGGLTNVMAAKVGGLGASNFWQLGGNAGTTAGTHFLGTPDNQPLEIKVNNERALRIVPISSGGANMIGGAPINFVSASAQGATIGGGGAVSYLGGPALSNWVTADFGTVGGGWSNSARGLSATAGGGFANAARARESTVAGGIENDAGGTQATIAGGHRNRAGGDNSFVGGGSGNIGGGTYATVAGGVGNSVTAQYGNVGGGSGNLVDAYYGVVGGGLNNTNVGSAGAAGDFGVIGGGRLNRIVFSSRYSVIPGGFSNYVSSTNSLAAGQRARAIHGGTFVWADDTGADFSSTTNRQFAIRANNGVMIQATNTALDLRGGGRIRVEGAAVDSNTPAFIHRATAGNITGNNTVIDHPHSNNDSGAVLLVTQNYNPGGGFPGVYNAHPIGVYYDGSRWRIFNEDLAAMPTNAAFNVLIIKP